MVVVLCRSRRTASNEGSLTPSAPTPVSSREAASSDAWRLRGICWMFLLKNLPWVAVAFATVFCVIPTVLFTSFMDGRVVDFKVYDAVRNCCISPPVSSHVMLDDMQGLVFSVSALIRYSVHAQNGCASLSLQYHTSGPINSKKHIDTRTPSFARMFFAPAHGSPWAPNDWCSRGRWTMQW